MGSVRASQPGNMVARTRTVAVALAIVLSIGAIYLAEIFLGPIEQVEARQSGSR
jgi:hypothetical protein